MEIDAICPHCENRVTLGYEGRGIKTVCPHCHEEALPHATDRFHQTQKLDQCPLCGCAHLFRQKDFNRKLGVALIVVGVLLSFWTYGISLLIVTGIDFFLYRSVGEVGCCYGCHSVFRGDTIRQLPPFDLELHDYYRSLPKQSLLEEV